MSLLRPAVFALVFALASPAAFGQDDDLLSPLSPAPAKKKAKKAKTKVKAKTPKTLAPVEDDLLAPLPVAAKTELLVKLSGGLKGAKLFLDRKEVGALPGPAIEVASGEHTVTVKRPGYADFTKTVNVQGGKLTEVVASLDAVAGLVSVTSDQAGAMVLLDGKTVGAAPLSELLVPPGEHRLTVRKDGFVDSLERLMIRAGREYPVSVRMTPAPRVVTAYADRPERTDLTPGAPGRRGPLDTPPLIDRDPIYERWYVWVGAAAVVAAAAAGTVVAARNAQPAALTPTEVCQGKCDGCIGWACFAPRL
ncbi:MAG: PEGA domain-containing protein [Myxococcaceae bacterium]